MSDSPAAILFDQFGSDIATVSGTDGVKLAVDAEITSPLPTSSGTVIGQVIITDGTDTAGVTSDGRLNVHVSPPDAPPGKTAVSDLEVNVISSSNYKNYTIPIGETIVIQRFIAGCEGRGGEESLDGSVVILYYDQGSGEPVQNLEIVRLYTLASSATAELNFVAPRPAQLGDRIRIRRIPFSGASQEVFGKWEGYY